MVAGDFNGDGIADLATAEGYAVSVYFSGMGDGTFTAAAKELLARDQSFVSCHW